MWLINRNPSFPTDFEGEKTCSTCNATPLRRCCVAMPPRDKRTERELRRSGWRVMVVWECQTAPSRAGRLRARITAFLAEDVRGHEGKAKVDAYGSYYLWGRETRAWHASAGQRGLDRHVAAVFPPSGLRRQRPDGREATVEEYIEHSGFVGLSPGFFRVTPQTGAGFFVVGDTYQNQKLLLVPHRIALAADEAGWEVNDLIWNKLDPPPESPRNRWRYGPRACPFPHETARQVHVRLTPSGCPMPMPQRSDGATVRSTEGRRAGTPNHNASRMSHGRRSGSIRKGVCPRMSGHSLPAIPRPATTRHFRTAWSSRSFWLAATRATWCLTPLRAAERLAASPRRTVGGSSASS